MMAVPEASTLEGLPEAHSAGPRGRTSVSGTVTEARAPPVTVAPAPEPPCDAHGWWQHVVWSVHMSQQQAGDGPRQATPVVAICSALRPWTPLLPTPEEKWLIYAHEETRKVSCRYGRSSRERAKDCLSPLGLGGASQGNMTVTNHRPFLLGHSSGGRPAGWAWKR